VNTSIDIASAIQPLGTPGGRGNLLGALRRERLASSLAALFGSEDAALTDGLLRLGQWVRVRGGERLFRQGEPGDSMYIVVVGRLVALREDGAGRRRVVGQIRPGESVGEMGLLATQPRSATVQASRDSVVVRISEEAFRQVVAEHPQLLASTARLVTRRTTDLMRGVAPIERPKNIAIVPLRRSVRCAEFVEGLRRALERRGRRSSDRARADAVLAANDPHTRGDEARSLVLSRWLDEQEPATTRALSDGGDHDPSGETAADTSCSRHPQSPSPTPTSAARDGTATDLAAVVSSTRGAGRRRDRSAQRRAPPPRPLGER
jgi:NTE family protein